jgi:hypothetical protein
VPVTHAPMVVLVNRSSMRTCVTVLRTSLESTVKHLMVLQTICITIFWHLFISFSASKCTEKLSLIGCKGNYSLIAYDYCMPVAVVAACYAVVYGMTAVSRPCAVNVCRNGALCTTQDSVSVCLCTAGYTGMLCETGLYCTKLLVCCYNDLFTVGICYDISKSHQQSLRL